MTVCLNMIVKNEAHVIRRCLDSVRPYIDCWVIVDTGSTDGTQDLVRACLAQLPGELHERPWRNFGFNRSEALEIARAQADYLLFIDADETLRVPAGWHWPTLGGDAYFLQVDYSGTVYDRLALVATRLDWRWEGVLHEYPTTGFDVRRERLPGPCIVVTHDGARARDPDTFKKDVAILEQALREEPANARYAFYLAQSLRDAGELSKARDAYDRRAAMGGWEEEVWCSKYRIGQLSEALGDAPGQVQAAYLAAYQARPGRAEPLHALARYHRRRGEHHLAYLFASRAARIPRPADMLFIEADVYEWRSLDECCVAASFAGEMHEGLQLAERLLREGKFDPAERSRIAANVDYYRRAVSAADSPSLHTDPAPSDPSQRARHALDQSFKFYQQARYDDAVTAAHTAISLAPDLAEAHNNLAAAYAKKEMWDDAIAAATEAIRLKPDFSLARNNLAWAQREKKT